ncbi:hypothetical protein AVEN_11777-1 [Araneus ventricosus]|uniref:Mos1 transposase HTH domain-containing protein n=1 Tax=Araneus ventricosus TaxID=182803 RepID=A0A4Y2QLQ1_ARAVE|nr:hypothetical protein AVEN_11777-1 [Araneus ventricosus]
MDSSRSAQRAVIQFIHSEREHASEIYRRMTEVYGEQYLARCTMFRWYQRYEAGSVNIKVLPRPLARPCRRTLWLTVPRFVDELIRQNRRITALEIAVELSISKGTVYHIIHEKRGYGNVCAQWMSNHLSENQKTVRMGVCLTKQFLH